MIFFVGPLPPPVHGFSAINQIMLNRMRENATVQSFDVGPNGLGRGFFQQAIGLIKLWLCFFWGCVRLRPGALYIGLSGGLRQLVDAIFVVCARLFKIPIFAHHHSFAYVNSRPMVARVMLSLLKGATHIVLCEEMGRRLSLQYDVAGERLFVLSNAAFVDTQVADVFEARFENTLRIGFLSNVTFAKGIFVFFDLLDDLRRSGYYVEADVAGPVDPAIAEEFGVRMARLPTARHLGAIYNEDKVNFFRRLDLLAFPTQYVNEAEPVTIIEAISHGVPVIAADRGCISCLVSPDAGVVVHDVGEFVKRAKEEIVRVASDGDYRRRSRSSAQAQFIALHEDNRMRLETLMLRICGETYRS